MQSRELTEEIISAIQREPRRLSKIAREVGVSAYVATTAIIRLPFVYEDDNILYINEALAEEMHWQPSGYCL